MPTKMLVDVGLFVRFIILALMAVEENINDIDVKYIVDIAKMNSDLLVRKTIYNFFFNSYFILIFIEFNIRIVFFNYF